MQLRLITCEELHGGHSAPRRAAPGATMSRDRRTYVWDLGVRAFHWSLVASVTGAMATGFLAPRWWLDIHVVLGSIVAALIGLRIVWGGLGTTYARFGSFLVSPLTAARYAFALVRGGAPHFTGHNPVGTLMIVALIMTAFILIGTGVVALGGIVKQGPLASIATYAAGVTGKNLHEAAAWLLLMLIAGHVSGVVIESIRTRENLVASMLSGYKRIRSAAVTSPPSRARPWQAAAVAVALAVVIVPPIVATSAIAPASVPSEPIDAVYLKECSACHSAHHPSLAPAATWTRIIDNLDDHFGDNAGLDQALAERLRLYLTANSAEVWDTEAANLMRVTASGGALRITETVGWKHAHRDVDPAAFKTKAVGGKLNCAACHADANAGRFAPRAIELPKERTTP